VVDVVGDLRVQVPERVVGDGGQVNDRVEAAQVLDADVADVHPQGRHRGGLRPERAALVQRAVQADDLVSSLYQTRDEHGSDIAVGPVTSTRT